MNTETATMPARIAMLESSPREKALDIIHSYIAEVADDKLVELFDLPTMAKEILAELERRTIGFVGNGLGGGQIIFCDPDQQPAFVEWSPEDYGSVSGEAA